MFESTIYEVEFAVEEFDGKVIERVEVTPDEVPDEATPDMVAVDKAAEKSLYTHIETLRIKNIKV